MKFLAISGTLFLVANSSLVMTTKQADLDPQILDASIKNQPEKYMVVTSSPEPVLGSEGNFANMCGNFMLQPENQEECDNGNRSGCKDCQIEPGYECRQRGDGVSFCRKIKKNGKKCGNGKFDMEDGEECDDKNTVNETRTQGKPGDGTKNNIRSNPTQENGQTTNYKGKNQRGNDLGGDWKTYSEFCGDGHRESFEECDDGNTENKDGCSDRCQVQMHWACSIGVEPTYCYYQ